MQVLLLPVENDVVPEISAVGVSVHGCPLQIGVPIAPIMPSPLSPKHFQVPPERAQVW